MGNMVVSYGMPAIVALLAGLRVGAALRLANGFLVARLRLPPFIVTLGTWNIVMAICLIYSANETMREADVDRRDPVAPHLRHQLQDRRRGRHARRGGDDRCSTSRCGTC